VRFVWVSSQPECTKGLAEKAIRKQGRHEVEPKTRYRGAHIARLKDSMSILESSFQWPLNFLCRRALSLLLLMGITAWTSEFRATLADLNRSEQTADAMPAKAMTPKAVTACDDSLYLAMKQLPVQNLSDAGLAHYLELDKACKSGLVAIPNSPAASAMPSSSASTPVLNSTNTSTYGRGVTYDPGEPIKPWSGFKVMAWVGAISTMVSGTIMVAIDDDCEGFDGLIKTSSECREEAQEKRKSFGTFALLSAVVMAIGIAGSTAD
jgi:hypothetical protein